MSATSPWLAGQVLQTLVGAQESFAVGAVMVHVLQGVYAEWDEAAASDASGRRDTRSTSPAVEAGWVQPRTRAHALTLEPLKAFDGLGVELKAIWKTVSVHAQSSECDSQYEM